MYAGREILLFWLDNYAEYVTIAACRGHIYYPVNQRFMNMNNPRVAIVGATGAVGVEILSCL